MEYQYSVGIYSKHLKGDYFIKSTREPSISRGTPKVPQYQRHSKIRITQSTFIPGDKLIEFDEAQVLAGSESSQTIHLFNLID